MTPITFGLVGLPVGVYRPYGTIMVDFAGQEVDRDRFLRVVFLHVQRRLCHSCLWICGGGVRDKESLLCV